MRIRGRASHPQITQIRADFLRGFKKKGKGSGRGGLLIIFFMFIMIGDGGMKED